MAGEVGQNLRVLRVGVTVAAEVRAGVVHPYVLADDAPARLALPFVLFDFGMDLKIESSIAKGVYLPSITGTVQDLPHGWR